MTGRLKAKVKIMGVLAFVETELGERAVVPVSSLCSMLRRFRLKVAEGDRVECPETIEIGESDVVTVDASGESEE
ncbi:MAG: hypothetical protein GSR80_000195 [Desulfurococcales archaeon]|nr:hypothetical protein [Desulfurococcales archaeon]